MHNFGAAASTSSSFSSSSSMTTISSSSSTFIHYNNNNNQSQQNDGIGSNNISTSSASSSSSDGNNPLTTSSASTSSSSFLTPINPITLRYALWTICVLGVFLNVCVFRKYRHSKYRQSASVRSSLQLLCVMAAADTLSLLALMLALGSQYLHLGNGWLLAGICKVDLFLIHASSAFGVWCWLVLSAVRYLAIHHPYKHLRLHKKPLFIVFCVAIGCCLLECWILFGVTFREDYQMCGETLPEHLGKLLQFVEIIWTYFLPSTLITLLDFKVLCCQTSWSWPMVGAIDVPQPPPPVSSRTELVRSATTDCNGLLVDMVGTTTTIASNTKKSSMNNTTNGNANANTNNHTREQQQRANDNNTALCHQMPMNKKQQQPSSASKASAAFQHFPHWRSIFCSSSSSSASARFVTTTSTNCHHHQRQHHRLPPSSPQHPMPPKCDSVSLFCSSAAAATVSANNFAIQQNGGNGAKSRRRSQQLRILKRCLWISVIDLGMNLPNYVLRLYLTLASDERLEQIAHANTFLWLQDVSQLLYFAQFAMNALYLVAINYVLPTAAAPSATVGIGGCGGGGLTHKRSGGGSRGNSFNKRQQKQKLAVIAVTAQRQLMSNGIRSRIECQQQLQQHKAIEKQRNGDGEE